MPKIRIIIFTFLHNFKKASPIISQGYKDNAKVRREEMKKKVSMIAVAVIFVLGFIIGNGVYSLYNADALSYLSSDSSACNNCHVMNQVYADYNKSSHQSINCIDCHLPHSFVRKWVAKAQTGLGHAYHFTFDKDLPPNFTANADTKAWAQENCIRCHGDYAANSINPTLDSKHNKGSLDCLSCHQNVGHLRSF